MSQLIQLPGSQSPQGQWVAPDRVSSIEAKEREYEPPCVVLCTKDGACIVINAGDWNKAVALRDSIAGQLNEALKPKPVKAGAIT
jgi:hypothetical protein